MNVVYQLEGALTCGEARRARADAQDQILATDGAERLRYCGSRAAQRRAAQAQGSAAQIRVALCGETDRRALEALGKERFLSSGGRCCHSEQNDSEQRLRTAQTHAIRAHLKADP